MAFSDHTFFCCITIRYTYFFIEKARVLLIDIAYSYNILFLNIKCFIKIREIWKISHLLYSQSLKLLGRGIGYEINSYFPSSGRCSPSLIWMILPCVSFMVIVSPFLTANKLSFNSAEIRKQNLSSSLLSLLRALLQLVSFILTLYRLAEYFLR